MSYIFPKRRLRDGDVLDPTELNEDVLPAAELYSGKLNEHNFEAGLNPTTAAGGTTDHTDVLDPKISGAYWNVYYAEQEATPAFGTPDNYNNPSRGTALNEFVISNSRVWQPIDDATQTITTGSSTLWVIGHAQYVWLGFNKTGFHDYADGGIGGERSLDADGWVLTGSTDSPYCPSTQCLLASVLPCKLQFALRLDGQVLPWTITGFEFENTKLIKAYQPDKTGQSGADLASGADILTVLGGPVFDGIPNGGGIAPEVFPVRLGTILPVTPGTHTVDIVVRRLDTMQIPTEFTAQADRLDVAADKEIMSNAVYSAKNRVCVFNRQLMVVDLPTNAQAATTFDSISVPAFGSEEVVSAQTLGQGRIDAVRAKFNSIESGALSRGALNHKQLASKVGHHEMVTIEPGATKVYHTYYPGFNTDTFTTSASGSGWRVLRDDASPVQKLQVTNISLDKKCVLIVIGNVEVVRLYGNGTDANGKTRVYKHPNAFGALCFGYMVSGGTDPTDVKQVGISEVYFNADKFMSEYAKELDDERHDIALFQVFTVDEAGAGADFNIGTTLDHIGIYGSSMSPMNENADKISATLTGAGRRDWSDPTGAPKLSGAGPTSGNTIRVVYRRGSIQVIQLYEA